MAVGAKDYIDQLLVRKYADEKVDNHDGIESMVSPEKMMEAMNDLASVQRHMALLSHKLNVACYDFNARAAQYKRSADLA